MGLSIAITGAGGFVGRATVAAALARGHQVRALLRRPADLPPGAEPIACDLAADPAPLADALAGADAVIHTAASMSGDPGAHARDTLAATRGLRDAMAAAAPDARLVLVSSIAVYDADADAVTEDTPLDPRPETRDAYARAKLAQEALLADAPFATWIARPGFVFGPGRIWHAHLGHRIGPLLIRLDSGGPIPLLSRAECAAALVRAAETAPQGAAPRAVNLLARDLPDARRYLAALGTAAPPYVLAASWQRAAALGRALSRLPGLRLPGLLQPRTLRARFAARRYGSARAEAELGWIAGEPFENAMRDALREAA